jgi:hypothetical protein
MTKKNPSPSNLKHGGYVALKEAKQGILPRGNTRLGRALKTFRDQLESHFDGGFNPIQEAYFGTIVTPLFIYLWSADPIKEGTSDFLHDWKWSLSRLDTCYKKLIDLSTTGTGGIVPDLKEIIIESKED